MANEARYEVVWPRGQRQAATTPLAPRLNDLNGKKIAQLWDYVFRGDEVFELLEEGLRARFPTVEFVSWREFGSTHDQDERAHLAAFADKFRAMGVDAVISGMAC
jgi:hypothetical protein